MTKKIITRLKDRRKARKNLLYINGISVPRDRSLWTDDLEREIAAARARW